MAGLLDGFTDFIKTPEGQGLLSAGFAGLAGAQRGAPINSLGRAGLAGLSGYGNAIDRQTQQAESEQMRKYRAQQMSHQQMQMDSAKREQEQQAQMRALAGQFLLPAQEATPAGPEVPVGNALGNPNLFSTSVSNAVNPGTPAKSAMPARFDREGYAAALEKLDPIKGLAYQQAIAKDDTPITLKDGDSLVDRKTLKPILTLPKTDAAPAAVKEYQFAVGQGYNGSFQQFQLEQKKAGASNVNNFIPKMGESIAAQIGPMIKDTYGAANGAVSQIDAAGRIVKAIDSGQIIAGPMANGRLKVAQVGQLLGVTGKDEAETIARSRDVIRGLSEMTLQGRKQMTGQGAITESEGRLAEKAMSGDINDLTPAEIKQLARASARASKFVYDQHQQNLGNLRSDPNTAKLEPFYKTPPLPSMDFMQEAAPQSIHDQAEAILRRK